MKNSEQTKVVRYADDFVVLAPSKVVLDVAIVAVKDFLATVGLEIREAKTRMLHTLDKSKCPDGSNKFKFLGYEIFQIPVGKYRAGKAGGGRRVSWAVRVLPHPKNVKKHFDSLRGEIKASRTPEQLIRRVNLIIRGWCNYFSKSDAATHGMVSGFSRRLYIIISNWVKRTFKTRKRIGSV